MQKPDFIDRYLEKVKELEVVGDPLFSRGTYQVEVQEKKESYFPFLQIKDNGQLTDFFCSCEESEKGKGCPHLAKAWLLIVGERKEPLHVRFQQSFWNHLFQSLAKRVGYQTIPSWQEASSSWVCESKTKKKLFSIEGSFLATQEKLQEFFSLKKEETEETSLKFSNWSFEEMAAYKQGRGGHLISYEFSFWSDLAKWLFGLQEQGKKYQVSFFGEGLPKEVKIDFEEVKVWFYLSEVSFPFIIPSLATIDSPLKVFDLSGKIASATYDPKERKIEIVSDTIQGMQKKEGGQRVGDWIFVPHEGFYRSDESPLFLEKEFGPSKIGPLLSQHYLLLQQYLPIFREGTKARYHLYFDLEKNLHIETYLFEKKDLQAPLSALYFPWVYLEKKGFFLVEDWFFEGTEKVISKEEMASFISTHRVFLQQFRGFEIHLGSLESHLVYRFTKEGDLLFEAELNFPERYEGAVHFDGWVYIPGFGFYMKRENAGKLPLHPGLLVPKEEIGSFIDSHLEELEQIQGFFSSTSPILSSGLKVSLIEEERIFVEPKWRYQEGINPQEMQFFGNYLYMENKGFSRLLDAFLLPERYRKEIVIPLSQENSFLSYELLLLKPYLLFLDPKLKRPESLKLKVKKFTKSRKENEWWVDLHYESEIGVIDPISIWDAFQQKKNHLFSPAGLFFLKQMRFQWLKQLPKVRIDRKKGLIRLSTLEWMRLSFFEEIERPKGQDAEAILTRKLLDQLEKLETDRLLDLSKLNATLRPYQELGLSWLWFLYCHRLSGLLCDDMGLGKTHQTMALLAAVSSQAHEKGSKYLVVCPTSVIYHWEDLLKRFLPHIRVCTYYGLARSLDSFDQEYDLLLTSYGILRTGRENLRSFSFEIAIFDEIQIAKNEASQTHKALKAIRATMRLGLTGTPIENRLKELKALFDIVLPSYLPSPTVFRDFFINPIEKEGDEEAKELLSKLVKPFILRRKKKDVLTDLPEKIEEIAYCDLSDEQRKCYRDLLGQIKGGLYQELKDPNQPIAYLHLFSVLSQMKQLCDHPALFYKEPKKYENYRCGKWELFVELLQEAMDSGQKVVIFSQYLDMLGIIEHHLTKHKIGFASIKGATRNRKEELQRFKEDPECKVFVASLLAAGVGIDLTVASIVIHYDRWWNPAKENQATDRVHRIGQNRGVQVFKLVTKSTIEEEIHALIERKKGLLEEIVGTEDQITYLNRQELIEVFEKMFSEHIP